MGMPKITKAGYRQGVTMVREGQNVRDLLTKMDALHEQDMNWQPPEGTPVDEDGRPQCDRPDFEGEAISMAVGFADGVLGLLRNRR